MRRIIGYSLCAIHNEREAIEEAIEVENMSYPIIWVNITYDSSYFFTEDLTVLEKRLSDLVLQTDRKNDQ
ncbi:hypothetical protein [Spirochaeta cellobiosiphila]|uniref:hypothetical protein n=1 Tax=Spirochaeta cellobiosiphila TaxID=504483 RepID=UPI0012EC19C1|nr:hypothetical protein [Spirochaeta cellobiosiphila]